MAHDHDHHEHAGHAHAHEEKHDHGHDQQQDEAEGEHDVIAEELQGGYVLGGDVIRTSMVKVTKK